MDLFYSSFKGFVKVQQYKTLMTKKLLDLLKSVAMPSCYITYADCEFLYILFGLSLDTGLNIEHWHMNYPVSVILKKKVRDGF